MTTKQRVYSFVTGALLKILNSRFLNQSPCEYGFIGNVDAFSRENLASEVRQNPNVTVREILEAADKFKSCPLRETGLTVIEGEEFREANVWDIHELREMFRERKP